MKPINHQLKTCKTCKEEKERHDFYPSHSNPDGRQSECKACQKQRASRRNYRIQRDRIKFF